ncbi:MAG: GNAT family N-acetyltransferase [Blastocatellia bacterium]|nr:GNAT family N-acetyltransferase [Blastocatellia bacterium]
MNAKLKIRTFYKNDRQAIEELSGEVFSIYGNYRKYLPEWIDVPDVLTIVAELDSLLVGFIVVGIFQEVESSFYADILAIAVHPLFQRQGMGRTLLTEVISMIEQQTTLKIKDIRLTVADSNLAGQSLFKKLGFTFSGREGLYEGGQTALRMSRPLSKL